MAQSKTPARDALLVKYLNEAYGKEKQLETALTAQIGVATRPQLKKGLQEHLKVTKAQSRGLAKRIKELSGKATTGADLPGGEVVAGAAGAAANLANRAIAGAKGPLQALRGSSPADNDLRLVRDGLWNEAEEIAHYDVIEAAADALGDKDTVKLAKTFRREEERMQTLLGRQVAPLMKQIIKEEVPSAERAPATRSSRSASSRSGGSTGTTTRKASTGTRKASTTTRKAGTAARKTTKSGARKASTTARKTTTRAKSAAKSAAS